MNTCKENIFKKAHELMDFMNKHRIWTRKKEMHLIMIRELLQEIFYYESEPIRGMLKEVAILDVASNFENTQEE